MVKYNIGCYLLMNGGAAVRKDSATVLRPVCCKSDGLKHSLAELCWT